MWISQPFLGPLLKTATEGLATASGEVINKNDQYEVFNDPRAVSGHVYSNVTVALTLLSLIQHTHF